MVCCSPCVCPIFPYFCIWFSILNLKNLIKKIFITLLPPNYQPRNDVTQIPAVRSLMHRLKNVKVVVLMCQQPAVVENVLKESDIRKLPIVVGTSSHFAYLTTHFHVVHCSEQQESSWFGLPRFVCFLFIR